MTTISTTTTSDADAACAVATGLATRPGTDGVSADAASVYVRADQAVAAAVVDGIGHAPATVRLAPVLAEVAARASAARGPLAGLLTAALLVEDPGPEDESPDAVAVAAIRARGRHSVVAWVGDCRAYGWDGRRLRQYTTDHTVGEQLRLNGASWELAEDHDNWIRAMLSNATVSTVYTVLVPADEVLVLTSDGVHGQLDDDALHELVRAHHADPQTLAEALVAAVDEADSEGYRDDATAVVMGAAP